MLYDLALEDALCVYGIDGVRRMCWNDSIQPLLGNENVKCDILAEVMGTFVKCWEFMQYDLCWNDLYKEKMNFQRESCKPSNVDF